VNVGVMRENEYRWYAEEQTSDVRRRLSVLEYEFQKFEDKARDLEKKLEALEKVKKK